MSNLQSIWDDFNTPWSVINLVDYDSRWVTASSEKIGLTIIGNELVDNPDWLSALHIFFYRDDCVMPDDQFSQATIGGSDAANPNLGPGIRCAAGTNHGYVVRFVTAALYIYRVDTSSSVTTIGSVSTTVASLDVIRIEASGTSISAYKNEVLVLGPITSSTYTSGYSGICARTSTHTWKLDDWSAGAVIGATSADGTATQTIFPDSIAASTNMTGAVTAIDESVDSPDANWLTATSATAATACRVTFPTPSLSPTGDQHFRLWLRKTTGAANPLLSAYLYQAGVSRTLMIHHTPVSSTTG